MNTYNPEQKKAIEYVGDRPLLIDAGPGAGKTFVLIERIKNLIKVQGVKPESILIITFTRKAASQLKDRLRKDEQITTEMINKMHISTIHSLCNTIVDEFGRRQSILGSDYQQNMFISHNKDKFNFIGISFIPKSEIKYVVRKFNEFTIFDVDIDKLIKYIKVEHPIDSEFSEYIIKLMEDYGEDFEFPFNVVYDNDNYAESWFNAKYLAIAKAYPIYKRLLKKHGKVDLNFLQIEALKLLKNPNIRAKFPYKNILIDEFQDTDPIQMQIFEELLKNYESFTVVGDYDQSIYGFRGSYPEYFNEFQKKHNSAKITLQTNYRSTPDIVKFNENYINHYRPNESSKDLQANRNTHSKIYHISNTTNTGEAHEIVDLIKYFKSTGKIKNYSEVAVLFRSFFNLNKKTGRYVDKTIHIIKVLKEANIPYSHRGNRNLMEKDYVKSILTLMWYVCKDEYAPEYSWNSSQMYYTLRSFYLKYFDKENIISLSNKTNSIFMKYNNRKSYISSLSKEELQSNGIENPKDLKFLTKLNQIKSEFYSKNNNKITISDLYYKLIDLTQYNNSKNKEIHDNIKVIGNIIKDYEEIIDKYDLDGLFQYLNENLEFYDSAGINDEGSVKIMTIHQSKGLEFPVVFVGTFEENQFPRKHNDVKPSKSKLTPMDLENYYYVPKECYNIKSINEDDEENRIIYVAMTRAKDILILSSFNKYKESSVITQMQFDNPDFMDIEDIDDFINPNKNTELNEIKPQSINNEDKKTTHKNLELKYDLSKTSTENRKLEERIRNLKHQINDLNDEKVEIINSKFKIYNENEKIQKENNKLNLKLQKIKNDNKILLKKNEELEKLELKNNELNSINFKIDKENRKLEKTLKDLEKKTDNIINISYNGKKWTVTYKNKDKKKIIICNDDTEVFLKVKGYLNEIDKE